MSEMQLTERQTKMLQLIANSPTMSGSKMSEMLSVNRRTVERELSELKKRGLLKREGNTKDGVWRVIYP
jgi:ATP-dependent DNA helicase RecG